MVYYPNHIKSTGDINRGILLKSMHVFDATPVRLTAVDIGGDDIQACLSRVSEISLEDFLFEVIPQGGTPTGAMYYPKKKNHRMPSLRVTYIPGNIVVLSETLYPSSTYLVPEEMAERILLTKGVRNQSVPKPKPKAHTEKPNNVVPLKKRSPAKR